MKFKKGVLLFCIVIIFSFLVIAVEFNRGKILSDCRFISTDDPNDLDDSDNIGPEVIVRYNQGTNLVLIYYFHERYIDMGDIGVFPRANEARRISENQYSFVKDGVIYYVNEELPDVCYYGEKLESRGKGVGEEDILNCRNIYDKKECEDEPFCHIEITQREIKGIFGSPIQDEKWACLINLYQINPEESELEEVETPEGIKTFLSPEGGMVGTIFVFQIISDGSYNNIDMVWVEIYDAVGNLVSNLDFSSEDGFNYGSILDSSNMEQGIYRVEFYIKTENGVIDLVDVGYFNIYDPEELALNCIGLSESNNPNDDKANILFYGYGYDNIESIKEDIELQNDNLFGLEPFNSNKDKFNVWLVNIIGNLVDCSRAGDRVYCPIEVARGYCPFQNSFYNLLINDEFRSYAAGAIAGLSMNDAGPYILAHEFGHSFGGLDDEYMEDAKANYDLLEEYQAGNIASNCFYDPDVLDVEDCKEQAPWKDIIGNGCGEGGLVDCPFRPDQIITTILGEGCSKGNFNWDSCSIGLADQSLYSALNEVNCFEGCKYKSQGIFRSGFNTIMNHHESPPHLYGLWNEYLIQQKIDEYSGE